MNKLIAALLTGLFATSVFAQATAPAATPIPPTSTTTEISGASTTPGASTSLETKADAKAEEKAAKADAKAEKKAAEAQAKADKTKAKANAKAAEDKADALSK